MDTKNRPFGDLTAYYLARIAAKAPHALALAAQLFGVAPCPRCGFIKSHCRCHDDWKGTQ